MAFQVGEFTVEVEGPYPCWVSIADSRGNELRFSHKGLPDLRYATEKAIREAREKLRADAAEAGEPR